MLKRTVGGSRMDNPGTGEHLLPTYQEWTIQGQGNTFYQLYQQQTKGFGSMTSRLTSDSLLHQLRSMNIA